MGVADCIALMVSESTGTVRISRNGQIVTQIEKPRRLGGPPPVAIDEAEA